MQLAGTRQVVQEERLERRVCNKRPIDRIARRALGPTQYTSRLALGLAKPYCTGYTYSS